MHISSAFDSGNIEVVDATEPSDVRLRIQVDAGGDHYQWFHFRVSGASGIPSSFHLENAGGASYPSAWAGYQACRSVDGETWERVETTYDDGVLTIRDTPPGDLCWYAYFAPYPLERLHRLLAEAQHHPRARHRRLGHTVDGRDLDALVVGEPGADKRALWVIARQHPGESMASWWMEGFLARLLDEADPIARTLLERAVLYVVPHMNPDGSFRGHLRNNAMGANLNREWHAPTEARSPEVAFTLAAMDETGVDLCLDVHGDEELPYNFISGAEGTPGFSSRLAALDAAFQAALERANPDFQRVHGYPVDAPGTADMSMCTNAVGERFDCLAMTLEMPFKDNANAPDERVGWSPDRCASLGASALDAMVAVVDDLR
jgi:murein tripeptide amidase MpaA